MSELEFLRPDIAVQPNELPWLTHHDEGELAVDVYETPKAIFIKTAIAGVKPEHLSLSLSHDMLTIRGARGDHDEETAHDERRYLSRECHWGSFSRTIILPAEINSAKTEATFRSGLLMIKLPKTQKHEEIKVKVEEE